jgi:hypothetical protein
MLLNTTNGARSLYTVLSLQIKGKPLRHYVYSKRFGELEAVAPLDKLAWTHGGSLQRFDVVSKDKSCQLELTLPLHVDGMVDCFHIQRISLILHKYELFPSMPFAALPPDNSSSSTMHIEVQ